MSAQAPPRDSFESNSETKNPLLYSRKEKSLGVLCSNFLKLYNRDDVQSIGLDHAANQLGVERRRIYDIVNILESVGILTRKAKNQYHWKGFGAIPRALDRLKEEGLRENQPTSNSCNPANLSSENNHEVILRHKTEIESKRSASSKVDSRKEKSLGLLAQQFVKLFLCSKVDLISLDDAATTLLGDIHYPTAMRNTSAAKVRRLYDIANVFSSVNLIEKTHHPESRKPAFRWLGLKGHYLDNGLASTSDSRASKKRVFGTEITNIVLKKCKADPSTEWCENRKENMPVHLRTLCLRGEQERSLLDQQEKHTKSFVFGPFSPASAAPKEASSQNKNVRPAQNLEDLASYRPHYRNQAMSDLFDHYVSAWKSWYAEADGKKRADEVSYSPRSYSDNQTCLQQRLHTG